MAFKKHIFIFLLLAACLQFSFVFAQESVVNKDIQPAEPIVEAIDSPKIISVQENFFTGVGTTIKGVSLPGATITVVMKDESDKPVFASEVRASYDGAWTAYYGQPLKMGKYYVEAIAENKQGIISMAARSEAVKMHGPFAFIILCFAAVIAILLGTFVAGWFASRRAEAKRWRRILMSQRDVKAAHNVIKADADKALKKVGGRCVNESTLNEIEFLLKRIEGNAEKMDKYVVKGIDAIGKCEAMKDAKNILKLKNK